MTTGAHPPSRGAPRSFYETLAGRKLHPHTVKGIQYRNHVIAGYLKGKALRVLEVGPGEGWLSGLLIKRGHRVVAVDLTGAWSTELSGAPAPQKTMGRITALPFADGTFDAVVAAEVVEHIPEMDVALKDLARVLRPGGHAVITVPYQEILNYVTCPDCGIQFEANGHVHTFDREGLAKNLRDAGLEPLKHFTGPTRFSREILRRVPIAPFLPALKMMDRLSYRTQKVTDTWLLMTARRP